MAEEQQAETSSEQQEPREPEAPRRSRRRVPRLLVRAGALLLAIVAGLIVALLSVDLGPRLKGPAESEASKYLKRPMRIGRLSARLITGRFVLDEVVIEGLSPTDRPFLTAKKISVGFPWWSIVTRRLVVESIDMTDWDMTVESFPNGRHSMPKLTPERKGPRGPSRFTTTVRSVLASRGQFTYLDHGTPWSTVARNLTVSLYRSDVMNDYRGRASFSNGTIRIQSYQPFAASMTSRL